ncbi:MAG: hypothetical protein IKN55_11845 [Oscillospiraceae bacterium]|nr:hypothetical protein [Oscillospiraceae bacterium]
MPGPHKRRTDVPEYDGSYDPTDLGAGKTPGAKKPVAQRREVASTVRRPAQPVQQEAPQPEGTSAGTYLVLMKISAAVLAVCVAGLGALQLYSLLKQPGSGSVATMETLRETIPATVPVTDAPTAPPPTDPPETEPPVTEPPETEPPETETERPRTWDVLYEELLNGDTMAWGARFDVVDVDGNGIPELFVSEGDFTDAPLKIYTVQDETAILVGEIHANDGEVTVVPEQHQIYWSSGAWPREFHVYLLNEAAFTERELLVYQLGLEQSFSVNGASVSIYEFSRTVMGYLSQHSIQHVGRKFSTDEAEKLPQKAASHSVSEPFYEDPWWEDYQTEPPTELPRATRPHDDDSKPHSFFDDFFPSVQPYLG